MSRGWKHKISFKHFWDTDDHISKKGELASLELERLKLHKHFEDDWALDDFIAWFKDVEDVQYFDGILSDLYDWADANRVWVATSF